MENMDRMCKYCNLPEDKQDSPGLVCMTCVRFVHISCLRRPGTPGDFTCDVFFDFTCEHCSDDKTEKFVRNRFPWVNVILLTLHHLNYQSYGISNNGFFHYKTHICYFIDRHWSLLLGSHTKQKKNWVGTIAGALSVYNNLFFRSGSTILGETGWWKLLHNFSPAVAAHILQEMSRDKLKGRSRNSMGVDRALFTAKVASIGYKELVNEEPDGPLQPPKLEPGAKRRRLDTAQDHPEPRLDAAEDNPLDGPLPPAAHEPSSEEALFRGFDFHSNSYLPPSDSSSIHSFQQTALYEDSDTRSGSPYPALAPFDEDPKPYKPLPETKKKQTQEEKQIVKRDNLFSTEPNSIDLPWIEELPEPKKGLVEMTQYEEVQLLKQVEGLIPKVRDPNGRASLYQLKAKLALRRLKRHKHLPLFDLDKALKVALGQGPEAARAEASAERVLDRFQRSYLLDNLSGTIALWSGGTVLPSRGAAKPFRSPYSGAALKPYIRRDARTQPLWLRLTDELLTKANRHVPGYSPPARASLDFSYVRPQHLAAVNSLAAQFFWPGIDLSESLEYPEFSCVVTYRQLVVGFAFLVPDVGAHEAYISFVLTRPEWRNAGIGSFMLYHLLQTCSGKDVTLHVSPTNPAIFLYQKFGFKVEELIQDFYEKYYDIDYKGCRHALFLRLVR